MRYELTIIPDTQIALFCWSGPITLKDREKNLERLPQFCSENGISQVIVDTRQQVHMLGMTETFEFGVLLSKAMRGIQFAIVRHSSDVEVEFVDAVAASRRAHCRSFVTLEEAQRWLERRMSALVRKWSLKWLKM